MATDVYTLFATPVLCWFTASSIVLTLNGIGANKQTQRKTTGSPSSLLHTVVTASIFHLNRQRYCVLSYRLRGQQARIKLSRMTSINNN